MAYSRFITESRRTKPKKGPVPGWLLKKFKEDADRLKKEMDALYTQMAFRRK